MQVLDVRGDWIARRPDLRPGGWAFQYANPHYPDVDDTAVVAMAMDRVQKETGRADFRAAARARARVDRRHAERERRLGRLRRRQRRIYYLNNIPFADHGALLDPPTEDVTARCLSMLAQFGETVAEQRNGRRAASTICAAMQLADGSWYGRWGMNYIYGTWSVLCALNVVGLEPGEPMLRKAVDWLVSIQNPDGGWGEDGSSYKLDYRGYEQRAEHRLADCLGADRPDGGRRDRSSGGRSAASTIFSAMQGADGLWTEERYTATGFPRVFYLRYHGYAKFFPLWALARYRNITQQRYAKFGM